MTRYRLFIFQDLHLTGAEEIEAKDDAEAARLARDSAESAMVELWRDDHKVRTIGPTRRTTPPA